MSQEQSKNCQPKATNPFLHRQQPTTPLSDRKNIKEKQALFQDQPTISNQKTSPKKNIFPDKIENRPSLFGDSKKQSINLFSLTSDKTQQSIFSKFCNPLSQKVDKSYESDDEEKSKLIDDLGLNFQTQPAIKEMKYKYENVNEKLKEFSLKIFKNGSCPKKEDVYISIESNQQSPNTLFLITRNKTTMLPVFKGILASKTKLKSFNGRGENLMLQILTHKEENKLFKQIIKMQFLSIESCKQFQTFLTDYFA